MLTFALLLTICYELTHKTKSHNTVTSYNPCVCARGVDVVSFPNPLALGRFLSEAENLSRVDGGEGGIVDTFMSYKTNAPPPSMHFELELTQPLQTVAI